MNVITKQFKLTITKDAPEVLLEFHRPPLIYSNAISLRLKNKRVTVESTNDGAYLIIENYAGEKAELPSCIHSHKKGIRTTVLGMSTETMEAVYQTLTLWKTQQGTAVYTFEEQKPDNQ